MGALSCATFGARWALVRALPFGKFIDDATIFLSSYMRSSFAIGIGCRRGASIEQIDAAVRSALGDIPFGQISAMASIDIKRDEPALIAFAARNGLPLLLYSIDEISTLATVSSDRVKLLVGVDGVCEPCALLASNHGIIRVAKQVHDGVTVAIAETRQNTREMHENG